MINSRKWLDFYYIIAVNQKQLSKGNNGFEPLTFSL